MNKPYDIYIYILKDIYISSSFLHPEQHYRLEMEPSIHGPLGPF